jgi:hypothetical protein
MGSWKIQQDGRQRGLVAMRSIRFSERPSGVSRRTIGMFEADGLFPLFVLHFMDRQQGAPQNRTSLYRYAHMKTSPVMKVRTPPDSGAISDGRGR